MADLLVIDDDPLIHRLFREAFRESDIKVHCAESVQEGLSAALRKPDAIVLDLFFPVGDGLSAFAAIQQIDARVPVIILTARSRADLAIEAMKLGAFDYQVKPLDIPHLKSLVAHAIEISRLARVPVCLDPGDADDGLIDSFVGSSPAMREVYKAIGRVAAQDMTVLILGESGAGKELVARAVYSHSRRARAPFLAMSCAAIPETLLESELFGHEQGAFTDAQRRRIGKFEQVSGGTLFLDEIGDMTPLTQSKFLRVLQDQTFERLGGSETIRTNARLIAATSRDLERLVASGSFRQDLFYRLNVFTIRLPPLRDRREDIHLLANYFIRRFSGELTRNELVQIDPEAMSLLERHSWPGNIRELQSVLKQSLLHTFGNVLLPEFLPAYLRDGSSPGQPSISAWDELIDQRLRAGAPNLHRNVLDAVERELLVRVLARTGGNQVKAAQALGISRRNLREKMAAHEIAVEHFITAKPAQPDPKGTN